MGKDLPKNIDLGWIKEDTQALAETPSECEPPGASKLAAEQLSLEAEKLPCATAAELLLELALSKSLQTHHIVHELEG